MCVIIISMTSEMIRALKALSDPTRLEIVEFLSAQCCGKAEVDDAGDVYSPTAGEVCCHITGADKISSTISHHLHELEDAGLVNLERRGKTTVCSLRPEALHEVSRQILMLVEGENKNDCC
jgi:ArsR family transcriptional regulator